MPHTLVCFHAHPDDEALLTAGTMAKAAAAGHRVVLVVATRGEVGEVAADFLGDGEALGARRWHELERAAEVLGVARLEWLGYGDSGSAPGPGATIDRRDPAGPVRFVDADPDEAAARLADILREERADVLTTYDPNGGYGHPDHVQVHHVGRRAGDQLGRRAGDQLGRRAGEVAATPAVLEATIDRQLMRTGVELATSLGYAVPPEFTPETFEMWYTPAEVITHAVDVSAHLQQKRAAMEAHASQATAADPSGTRSLDLFLGLPDEYFALAFGTEWYVEPGRPAGQPADDVFASLVSRA